MLAKRAYDIYANGCGIARIRRVLKHKLDAALETAIEQNKILHENESGKTDPSELIVRVPGTPPIVVRKRGNRRFGEIPPSEVQLVARRLAEKMKIDRMGSDDQLRAILAFYELIRLNNPTGMEIIRILEQSYPYIDEIISAGRA